MHLVDSIHDQRRVCWGELWSLLAVTCESAIYISRFPCYPYFTVYLIWEQDGFAFLAFAKILYIVSSALQVERQRATCIVFSFCFIHAFLYSGDM